MRACTTANRCGADTEQLILDLDVVVQLAGESWAQCRSQATWGPRQMSRLRDHREDFGKVGFVYSC